ncbi:MAG: UDP-N-acetylmuramoyl-tripeptide--D-alanyl-D-alanine ligase [Nocardioides sp.]
MTLAEIASVVGGRVDGDRADGGGSAVVDGEAFLDSRSPVPGGLFVAFAGQHADGHDYAAAAVAGGAAAVLGSRATGVPTVIAPDPARALARLARHVVDRLPATVFALTGSQGKTGTKDLLAHVLTGSGRTVATRGNLNNELGVPLTVLRATAQADHLVVEMGARGLGHIAELCAIAPPRIAAVLNVGTAHVGEFGGREAIAEAKGEIVAALPADGVAVLNADDPLVAPMSARTPARVLTFGETGEVAWRHLTQDALGRPAFELGYAGSWRPVRLGQLGAHQVANAAAAAAMALAGGLDLDEVAARLSAARPASRWRMELFERPDGLVVVNDAYNANPASMRAALDTLRAIGRSGRRTVAVLGEMRELGAEAAQAHRDVGRHAATAGVDVVVCVGPEASGIADGAEEAGTPVVVRAEGRDDAIAWVRENVTAADAVLIKASRGVALEHVAEALLPDVPADTHPHRPAAGAEPARGAEIR